MDSSVIAALIIGFILGFLLHKKLTKDDSIAASATTPTVDTNGPVLPAHSLTTSTASTTFDADKAKYQAKQFVKHRNLDATLLKVFEEVRHYGAWSKRDDFARWNIGVSEVTSEKRKSKIAYYDIELEFLSFNFTGHKITLAFGDYRGHTPDGGWTETDIIYLLADKIILTFRYDLDHASYGSILIFKGVEEFHNDEPALRLLDQLSKLIDQKKAEDARRRKEAENKAYQGKFTL